MTRERERERMWPRGRRREDEEEIMHPTTRPRTRALQTFNQVTVDGFEPDIQAASPRAVRTARKYSNLIKDPPRGWDDLETTALATRARRIAVLV